MPSAITLTAEYCPERRRSSLVTLMFCGFTISSAVAGLAASQIVAAYGWQGLLVLGGVLPIALVPILWLMLPESARYLTLREGRARTGSPAVLRKIAPAEDFAGAEFARAGKAKGLRHPPALRRGPQCRHDLPVAELLREPAGVLPAVQLAAAPDLPRRLVARPGLADGGAAGHRRRHRRRRHRPADGPVRAAPRARRLYLAAAAASSCCWAPPPARPWLLMLGIFGAGFGVAGSQVGINALAAAYYPTASRATGSAGPTASGAPDRSWARWSAASCSPSAGICPPSSTSRQSRRWPLPPPCWPRDGCRIVRALRLRCRGDGGSHLTEISTRLPAGAVQPGRSSAGATAVAT